MGSRAFRNIGIVGGGAWGTALAQTLCLAGRNVLLWARRADVVSDINARHRNALYLPDVPLAEGVRATSALSDLASCDVILMVAPAQHLRAMGADLRKVIAPGVPVVICAKGIEQATGKLLVEVLSEVMPEAVPAVLSGPSFAADVVRGLPAAVTLAMENQEDGEALANAIGYRHLRIYWSSDLTGVQLGGALKNVLAIAAGIVEGKGLGASAHAALVTRGFAEMRRFGAALGARTETLMGLSGLGDLLLTCGSPQSRNMSLGRALAKGESLEAVLASRRSVSEGVYTAKAVVSLARGKSVEMPIAEAVHGIVEGLLTVDAAIEALLSRPQKAEM